MDGSAARQRTGGQCLVDQLLLHGADTAYCVPGESYLEILDALHDHRDRFTLINARHEAGAADMAEAYGKLTGRPGIAMVTRGPGACHAAVGVHIARQDSTPMILLIGQVGRGMSDREAFQEIDYRAMFAPVAKWVCQIEDADRVPEYLARAFRVATSGRPGPVVIALPEDMLTAATAAADAKPYTPAQASLTVSDAEALRRALAGAERPFALVGGSGWDDAAAAAFTRFAEANHLPTACSFRRQDIVPTRSPAFVGEFGTSTRAGLYRRIAEADVLLVVGARLGEITTRGYESLAAPTPAQRLIHLYPEAEEIGRTYAPDLGIVTAPEAVAEALAGSDLGHSAARADWCAALREEFLADTAAPEPGPWAFDLGVALTDLRDDLPEDVIVTLDAGNHTGWPQRYLRFGRPGREIGSTCGSMGYAVPAAVAASLRHPDRLTLAFVGDGGFMMSGNELATAAQHGGCPIVFLVNNGSYGTIRMHQERAHPGRVSGTELRTTDFCRIAEGLGAHAERVTRTADLRPAFERARAAGRPAVIECVTDPEQISTRTTISKLRDAAKAQG